MSRKEGGFTLIEAVVAAGVFAVAFTMIAASFTMALRVQRRSLENVRVIESARLAVESIAKVLRTTNPEDIGSPPGSGGSFEQNFRLEHRGKVGGKGCPIAPCTIQYRLPGGSGTLTESYGTSSDVPLTSAAVFVEDFGIRMEGWSGVGGSPPDGQQPRATVKLVVRDRKSPSAQPLVVQTTVSLRILEEDEY